MACAGESGGEDESRVGAITGCVEGEEVSNRT